MPVNPKRRKRILLLGGVAVLLGALAGGAYALRQARLDNESKQAGIDGRAALAREDYPAALDGLGRYLQRWGDQGAIAEDYVLYARARRHVESTNGKHLLAAIKALRKALDLDPANREARSDLFELYCRTGYATEALDLLDTMLAAEPNDKRLLRMKCELLEGLRRFQPAIDTSMKIDELAPDDIAGHSRTLRLLLISDAPQKQVDDWLAKVAAAHPDDPRFELLKSMAFARRRDLDHARELLNEVVSKTESPADAAAKAKAVDPDFLRLLVNELDASGRYADAMRVLDRAAELPDPALRRERVRRLWFARRLKDIADQMPRWTAEQIAAEPEIEALFALALTSLGRAKDAEPLTRELAARTDVAGKGWSAFVRFASPGAKADREMENAMRDAVATDAASAVLLQALGDVRSARGDPEMAFEAWTRAAEAARTWALPQLRISDSYFAKKQWVAAYDAAKAALERAPDDPDVIETYLKSVATSQLNLKQATGLLDSMKRLMTAVPERSDEMLPSYVELLARVDRAEAEKRLQAVLDATPAAGESTLIRLAQVAIAASIPVEDRLLDLSEKAHGVSPQLALARALAQSRKTGRESAVAAFDDARRRAANEGDPLEWEMARTPLLDAVGSPEAGPAWIRLAEAHPDVLQVQLGAIASPGAWKDRAAVARIIERLRDLAGEDGVTWQIAHATWVLGDPAAPSADVADVATNLDHVVRTASRSVSARVLLAQAFERLGNLDSAEAQFRQASNLAPSNTWIALQIARLSQRQGKLDASQRQLEQVLRSGDMAESDVVQAAYLLAVTGDMRRGTQLLEPVATKDKANRDGLLLLAQLYANVGQYERAIGICERLSDGADLKVLELTAALYAQLGKNAEADAAMARIDAVDAPPGERELARARLATRRGDVAAARSWNRKAVDAAPTSTEAWKSLLSQEIATGDEKNVAVVLDDPRGKDVDPVRFAVGVRPLCVKSLSDKRLQSLFVAALDDASNRPVLTEAIKAVVDGDGWSDPHKRAGIAQRLRALADANVRIQTLQIVTADFCAEAGDLRNAYDITKRSATQFPDSPVAARNWAQLLALSGRWDEALAAGVAWRGRSVGVDPGAELLIADALMHLKKPAEAAAGLEPLIPGALERPADNAAVLLAYMVALVRSGNTPRATEILNELARNEPKWRTVPLGVDPGRLGDAASAANWLRMCEALVPPTPDAQMQLARAWGGAWENEVTRGPELLAGARAVLARLVASGKAGADVHVLSATLSQLNGDVEAARKGYLEALKMDPSMTDAHNNLAILLVDAGEWQEAVGQANMAVDAAPKNANYRDTLARALRKGRRFEDALKALADAVALEPANPDWRVSLAETLVESGRADAARSEMTQFDQLVAAGVDASPEVRARADKLRETLKTPPR
jgi:tetratricopeptide (TPR) repeat protein